MSMLARYRKPGGIQQLVQLLESCLPKKRESLLKTICDEDANFGALVKAKILTVDKVFKWDPLMVCEVTTRMTDRALAIALKGLPADYAKIAMHTMRDMKKREVNTLLESLTPTPIEIESAHIKLIETVRLLQKEGSLKLDDNDVPVNQAMKAAA